ncbi:ribosomal RNA large subunit methyltransferase J [Pseudorhodoferax aquiterrae]|uniref:Ribosomal RNA large subunit methyltransferase J n=1 Tax=Pseudorhodoferax aquiterrae TaxID=747304 RepID=A0ABQ3FXQ1_9BURK|nr:23S rRNA (adenine(2030)-N(6))-methyltransferase RlmJ [Pseudorhodoferax aquiterrae]GHC75302.1 ribosomal RNA large subunit methyltransferase J [Pseudorhodoferax aquiterrae]
MFSYRHAFHAGNHADVLKHLVLVAILRHLAEKETALALLDSHAGAGLYRLDGDYAATSGEAADGVLRLLQVPAAQRKDWPAALTDYLALLASFNPSGGHRIYPGSPFVMHRLARPQDRLKLFEMHPTDAKTLQANIDQLEAGRQVAVFREDGFEGVRRFLPPPSRRALLLCDPSYELKSDYGRVVELQTMALQRFPTGTSMVWYPLIARNEAHILPRKLKSVATRAGKPWLHATLTVKGAKQAVAGERRPGLPASGVFVVNPPYTLRPALEQVLPLLAELLAQDQHAAHALETQGG